EATRLVAGRARPVRYDSLLRLEDACVLPRDPGRGEDEIGLFAALHVDALLNGIEEVRVQGSEHTAIAVHGTAPLGERGAVDIGVGPRHVGRTTEEAHERRVTILRAGAREDVLIETDGDLRDCALHAFTKNVHELVGAAQAGGSRFDLSITDLEGIA